jgi:hypothetical protein
MSRDTQVAFTLRLVLLQRSTRSAYSRHMYVRVKTADRLPRSY